jgi:hypothetical protein
MSGDERRFGELLVKHPVWRGQSLHAFLAKNSNAKRCITDKSKDLMQE